MRGGATEIFHEGVRSCGIKLMENGTHPRRRLQESDRAMPRSRICRTRSEIAHRLEQCLRPRLPATGRQIRASTSCAPPARSSTRIRRRMARARLASLARRHLAQQDLRVVDQTRQRQAASLITYRLHHDQEPAIAITLRLRRHQRAERRRQQFDLRGQLGPAVRRADQPAVLEHPVERRHGAARQAGDSRRHAAQLPLSGGLRRGLRRRHLPDARRPAHASPRCFMPPAFDEDVNAS